MSDRTESELREAERRYRQIIDSAVDYAIVTCDLDGHVTSWNEGARRVLGWSRDEMLGQTLHRIFTPGDVAAGVPEREMGVALRDGQAMDERWHLRKGDECFWASGELMRLHDDTGAPVGFVKIVRDRTEQCQADVELRRLNEGLVASEGRLQLAQEVGGMGVWQANLRTHESIWWPGMEQVHGLPAGTPSVPMADYYKLVHPQDRPQVDAVVEDALARGADHRVEYRVIWPDGSVHWLEGRGKVFLGPDGQPGTMAGVCMDITRRKHIENDLAFLAQASAELADLSDYQSTLQKIARLAVPHYADWCAVDMLAEDGSLRRVAVAHADPVQVELAHDLNQRFPLQADDPGTIGLVLRTGRSHMVSEMTDAMLQGEATSAEHFSILRRMGLRSYIGVPVTGRGRSLGVISFATAESRRQYNADDLALAEDLGRRAAVAIENAQLVLALQDSDRAKDVFLATLAHELRNPLAPIWNGLSIIKLSLGDRYRVEHVTEIIERQVAQLSRLVDDLLDMSRITTGKIELKKEDTNLVSILNSAIETARPHIEAAHHKLSVSFPDEPTGLHADPLRLAQVFSNLLNNAAKYTRRGGEIQVSAKAFPDRLVVSVRDTGTGIERSMLQKVFSLFTQVTHPVERRQGGLGIGLSLVRGLVTLHGGTVEARSEGLDRGSEFVVTLPREPALTGQAVNGGAVHAGGAGEGAAAARRILVVDDNVDAATTVAELLEMFGNEVALAHDGAAAVEHVTTFRPDVVLLDIGLPDINGYEVARRIRKLEGVRQPTLVALTGWGQQTDKKQALEAGFDQHWTKPVDSARLQELSVR